MFRFSYSTIVSSITLALALAACKNERPAPTPTTAKRIAPAAAAKKAADVPAIPACPEKPNILLISLDTLRFDATSLDPKGRNETRHLRQLAGVGVNFTRAYSTHDSTPPSHFSMLTGFVNGYQTEADVPEISIAHQLKKLGYRTFGVSANGNLSPEFTRSLAPFGSFVNLQDVWEQLPADRKEGMLKNIDARLNEYGHAVNDWNRMMLFSSSGVVMRYLEPRLEQRQPFFGFVNLLEAHDPYLPSPRTYDRAAEERGVTVPDLRNRTLSPELANPAAIADEKRKEAIAGAIRKAAGRAWSTTFDLDKKTVDTYRRRYRARVRELDEAVGVLIRALAQRKLLDSTIVIITSDHGEAFGEENFITHSFMNLGDREATNRVPLLIVFPPCYGLTAKSVADLCTIADIPPTIYDLLGIDPQPIWRRTYPGNIGRSLMPLIGSTRRGASTEADTTVARPISADERARQDREALERFKSLGYLQ